MLSAVRVHTVLVNKGWIIFRYRVSGQLSKQLPAFWRRIVAVRWRGILSREFQPATRAARSVCIRPPSQDLYWNMNVFEVSIFPPSHEVTTSGHTVGRNFV